MNLPFLCVLRGSAVSPLFFIGRSEIAIQQSNIGRQYFPSHREKNLALKCMVEDDANGWILPKRDNEWHQWPWL
jgi:hypothetical protein